ncbi:MAG TPA: N-6 DNA methylase, partial [Gemmatimonadaceae bacterium]|nr:N-6 DNA methylase [Gemmatimonadaceae bacterium]
MLSIPRATTLLRTASDRSGLAEILRELGFCDELLDLPEQARCRLGLPDTIAWAAVTRGAGSLRGLAVCVSGEAAFRETLTAVAERLSKSSPHLLWLVVAIRPELRELAVVCWTSSSSGIRSVSLVTNQERVFQSDSETLCAVAAAMPGPDLLVYNRWLETLGREAITRRFFRVLQDVVSALALSLPRSINADDRRELSLLAVSRLIFLSFLETKGWLDGDFAFLSNGFAECVDRGGKYHERVLAPLFFGTLNTRITKRSGRARRFGRIPFLNGGLFSRSQLEKRHRASLFPDEQLGTVFGSLLTRYRFTPREDTHTWSEASIDPEILGKAFEALMASADRKTSGAFYTPQSLVRDVTEKALNHALTGEFELRTLQEFRVLDPACGSGAFLVHALERLAVLRSERGEFGSLGELRRRVLVTSIFGVDNNPMAVWLCELRLWLSIVIESPDADPMRVVPLPNLDRNIRVGDSLAGGGFASLVRSRQRANLEVLRTRYIRAIGPRKRTLSLALDRYERTAAIDLLAGEATRLKAERKELVINIRSRDLFGDRARPSRDVMQRLSTVREKLKATNRKSVALRNGAALPFSFASHFADVRDAGGFDLVVGNPPWVRVHHIAKASRDRFKHDFEVYRHAAWESGAASAGAGKGFAAQIDLAALFTERSLALLRPDGVLGLLLPSKLWGSLAGGGVRRFLLERSHLLELEDVGTAGSEFDAAVYPSILIARARRSRNSADSLGQPTTCAASRAPARSIRWTSQPGDLAFDQSPGSPWLLVPPDVRNAFNAMTASGIPLADSCFGRPTLGVKTGFNRAYVVELESLNAKGDVAAIKSFGVRGAMEAELLQPVVRGEELRPWRTLGEHQRIIWPYRPDGLSLQTLPALARQWFAPHRSVLEKRTDLHPSDRWWSVFRTDGARCDAPRVMWADFGLTPRAIAIDAGHPLVPLNTCYVVRCPSMTDANALAALLNSPLVAAWLNVLAEPARGGYRRYLGWTMALLPIPSEWDRKREALAGLGARAGSDEGVSNDFLLAAAL